MILNLIFQENSSSSTPAQTLNIRPEYTHYFLLVLPLHLGSILPEYGKCLQLIRADTQFMNL